MDVVYEGDESLWPYPPYSGAIAEGRVWGRGASDTKGTMAIQIYVPFLLKEAGLLPKGDIITAVNGETITGSNDLVKLVKASAAGDTLELTVYRQGQTTTLTLTVGEQKTDALPAQTTDQNQQSQQGYYDGGQSGQSDNQFGGSWPFGFGFGG